MIFLPPGANGPMCAKAVLSFYLLPDAPLYRSLARYGQQGQDYF